MDWNQDHVGYFVRLNGCSAQVAREGRRYVWVVFHANGAKLWKASSRTLDEAKNNAEIMLRRAA